MTITVHVKLWGALRQEHPGPKRSEPIELVLPDGATVADLRLALNMPMDLVNHSIAFIKEGRASPDHVLQDSELLHLAPPVSGGGLEDPKTDINKYIEVGNSYQVANDTFVSTRYVLGTPPIQWVYIRPW